MGEPYYYDFAVAPYALPHVCEALHWNGVKDACITMEDGRLHIRWKRDVNRYIRHERELKCGVNPEPERK